MGWPQKIAVAKLTRFTLSTKKQEKQSKGRKGHEGAITNLGSQESWKNLIQN